MLESTYVPHKCQSSASDRLRSCLQDTVINSFPMIGKYINRLEFYRQCPPRRVKDIKNSDIENTSCVRNVIIVTPVYGIER